MFGARDSLEAYQADAWWQEWKMIGVGLFVGVLSSVLLTWWVIPQPISPLGHKEALSMSMGEMLQEAWSNLSEKEQKQVLGFMKKGIEKSNSGSVHKTVS